jgi:hypothetical protein
VSNIYIPEQDMGDLMRKCYCGENTRTLMDSEVCYIRRVLEQNLVASFLVGEKGELLEWTYEFFP